MYLVKPMKIDTNAGYNKEVGPAINTELQNLQNAGCEIMDVAQQGVDGRNAYIIIKYKDPRFDKNKKVNS